MGKNTFSTHLAENLTEYTHTEDISALLLTQTEGLDMLINTFVDNKYPLISDAIDAWSNGLY